MKSVHQRIHYLVTGKHEARPLILQIPYSLGIGVGMILFFNHLFKRRFNDEPSPLELEMYLYGENLNQYVINHERSKKPPDGPWWLERILPAFIGLAGGLAVGSGFVAFITVLDIVPRLAQMSRTGGRDIHLYEHALVAGAVVSTWADFFDWTGHLSGWWSAPLGLFAGMLRRLAGGGADGGPQCAAHLGEAGADAARRPASVDGHGFRKSGGLAVSVDPVDVAGR